MDIEYFFTTPLNQTVPPTVQDVNGAPFIYFDEAPTLGCGNGVLNITLGCYRNLCTKEGVKTDMVAVAYLRCNLEGALALRAAIDKALLMAAPLEGQVN
jgi:hypothetical protein